VPATSIRTAPDLFSLSRLTNTKGLRLLAQESLKPASYGAGTVRDVELRKDQATKIAMSGS
jgi:hypothetical protein